MSRVVFTPSGLSGTVEPGTTVLDAARRLGVDLDSVCGGRGVCGRCQVHPSTGSFPLWGIDVDDGALTARTATEDAYGGRRPLPPHHRLGCAARVLGDCVIDVPETSQVHRQVVRKDAHVSGVVVDPLVVPAYLVLPAAPVDPGASVPSLTTAVRDALATQHHLHQVGIDPEVLAHLHRAVAQGDGAVTVAVRRPSAAGADPRVVAVWPGFVDDLVGVAVDVGSTTVAAHLCDLATGAVLASEGRMNPQIRFGDDLMSRVSYVMMNPGGDRQLTDAVRSAVDGLVEDLLAAVGMGRDRVLEVVLVGNPVMHHLLLGLDPTPLGQAPFTLATDEAVTCRARDLHLDLPWAQAYVGPCIAGHVGADAAAALLHEAPHQSLHMQLLVDVGTNAEIVLGSVHGQWAASSPTGPAFEGAQISCGVRAAVGAVERVRIDPHTLEPRWRMIGCDVWSDDPGFSERSRGAGPVGVCGSGIVEVIAELFLAGVIDADGTIRGELAARTPRVVPDGRTFAYVLHEQGDTRLAVTQADVRAIQLAKAALRAGIDLLLEEAGHPEVHDIRLAGAFGAHISPLHAMVLGLVPDCPLPGVRAVGNAAGNGAVRALLSAAERAQLEDAARRVVKVETATEPRFQELFVAAMAFPHATAPTPHLAGLVTLPARAAVDAARPGRRSGRRRERAGSPAGDGAPA